MVMLNFKNEPIRHRSSLDFEDSVGHGHASPDPTLLRELRKAGVHTIPTGPLRVATVIKRRSENDLSRVLP